MSRFKQLNKIPLKVDADGMAEIEIALHSYASDGNSRIRVWPAGKYLAVERVHRGCYRVHHVPTGLTCGLVFGNCRSVLERVNSIDGDPRWWPWRKKKKSVMKILCVSMGIE